MMTTSKPQNPTSFEIVSDLEVVMTRVFNAPRKLVFEACTQAEHMSQWWGPGEYSMPVCEMDARPGGTYRMVQRAPDGNEYPFRGEFREVVPPERVVMTQIFEPYADHPMLVTVTFEDLGDGRTRLTDHMLFDTVESRDGTMQAGMESGARESYDRLADHLETMERGTWLERVLEAPRELVWTVWTDPQHVAQWWGPTGFTNTVAEMDVRPGGVWRFVMHGPDGVDYPTRIVFVEVDKPKHLVYDHTGADANDSPFRGDIKFFTEGDRRTRVIMRTLFPTTDIREMVNREYHAEEGARQTLDRLGAYLDKIS
jgi:uncharacterized protein YndB with AHSA1/START domain